MRRGVRRGQVWSMDLVIGVIIFLLAVGVFYFYLGGRGGQDTSKLQIEAQLVAERLTSEGDLSLLNGTSVEEAKLVELSGLSYEELKRALGIHGDFCIVLTDAQGNLVLIGNGTEQRVGIGHSDLNITLPDKATNPRTFKCGAIYQE